MVVNEINSKKNRIALVAEFFLSRFHKLEIWVKNRPLLCLGVDVARCACAIDMVVGVFEHLDVDLSKREIES